MKKPEHAVLLFIIACVVITIAGCSSSVKQIKSEDTRGERSAVDVSTPEVNRETASIMLSFPFTGDLYDLSYYQLNAYRIYLSTEIRLYRRVMGEYPDTMNDFVKSGFPLFWPRNVLTGAPVGVLEGRGLDLSASDVGMVKWEKFDDDHAKLTFIDLDYDTYRNEGTERWIENYIDFRWRNWDSYKNETHETVKRAFLAGLRPGDDDKEKAIDILGGTVPVNSVEVENVRRLYAMSGQLHRQFCGATEDYFAGEKNYSFPSTFNQLFSGFNDKPGFQNEHSLIIKENFADFANTLKSSGADLQMGFDRSNMTQYTWLKIDEIPLIVFGRIYDPDSDYGIGPQYLGVEFDKYGNNRDPDYSIFKSSADMSSPMITTDNLDQIDIPNEIAISIEDIPLGE